MTGRSRHCQSTTVSFLKHVHARGLWWGFGGLRDRGRWEEAAEPQEPIDFARGVKQVLKPVP